MSVLYSGQMPSPPDVTVTVRWMSSSRLPNGYLSGASSFPSSYLGTKHTRRKKSSIRGIYRMLLPTCWRMTIILFVSLLKAENAKLIKIQGSYDNFCLFCQIESSSKKKDDLAFFIFFTFKGKPLLNSSIGTLRLTLVQAGNGYSLPTVPANPSTLSFSTLSPPPTISKQPTFQLTGTTHPSPPSSSSP